MDNSTTVQYAGLIHQLVMKARSTIRDVDPQNDLTFLRIRSKKNEIMIAPGKRPSLVVGAVLHPLGLNRGGPDGVVVEVFGCSSRKGLGLMTNGSSYICRPPSSRAPRF